MPNQRVSIEEVRARRLAKEAEEGQTTDKQAVTPIPDELHTELLEASGGQHPGTPADAQQPTKTAPEPVSAAAPSPVAAAHNMPDLESFIASASPEQLAKLRMLASAKGLTAPSLGATKSADGSMSIPVHLASEIVEQLEMWADSDGVSLIEEAQIRVNEALTNYLYGDWSATETKPAVTAPVTEPVASAVATK